MELDYTTHCIPPEVCTQILSNLPVKALLQFRSVSKEWKLIIDTRDFASLHLTRYSNNRLETHLITLEHPSDKELRPRWFSRSPLPHHCQQTSEFDFLVPSDDIFFPTNPHSIIIAGDVEGLLLLVQQNLVKLNHGDLVLWNPSIRKSLKIPLPPSSPSTSYDLDLSLGFDPSTNDYKVVNMVPGQDNTTTLETFSLTTRSWRKGKRSFPVGRGGVEDCSSFSHEQSKKVHFQGSVHWVVSNYYSNKQSWKAFISLNMISDTLSQIPLPVAPYQIFSPYDSTDCPVVVAAGKVMGLLTSYVDASAIWKLESDDGQWSKCFSVNISNWDLLNTQLYLNKDGVLITIKCDGTAASICACDTETGNKSVVSRCEEGGWPFYIGAYIESLVLLSEGS